MKTLEQFKARFAPDGQRVVSCALEESRRHFKSHVSIEHLLLALFRTEAEKLQLFFEQFAINSLQIEGAVAERIRHLKSYSGVGYRISPEVTNLFWRAKRRAKREGRTLISADDILFVIAEERINSVLNSILLTMGITDFTERADRTIVRIAKAKEANRKESLIKWFFSSTTEAESKRLRMRVEIIETAIDLAWKDFDNPKQLERSST